MVNTRSSIMKKARGTTTRAFSCKKCGGQYEANPPDDVHTFASLVKPVQALLDPMYCVEIPYSCPNCEEITRLYWHDIFVQRQERLAKGEALTEEEYAEFIRRENLTCRECNCHSALVEIDNQWLIVCINKKCRKVLATMQRTKYGNISYSGRWSS